MLPSGTHGDIAGLQTTDHTPQLSLTGKLTVRSMMCSEVVVLGGGVSGLGAAKQLSLHGLKAQIFDLRARPGGITSSTRTSTGFVFDEGAHISFTNNIHVREIFEERLDGKVLTGPVYCNNYWQGYWLKHPAQVNMHGLPAQLIDLCISDFINALGQKQKKINNYRDWLISSFGNNFAETFPLAYTRKYHTTDAENLTTDWLGRRLYRPTLDEVQRGAKEHEPFDVHYVSNFRYPAEGGFDRFLTGLSDEARYSGLHEVAEIDLDTKSIHFTNGHITKFDRIISSLPLPVLIAAIRQSPEAVRSAAKLLSCSQAVVVNIGLNRPVDTKAQWTYFYDEDIPFARTSFPGNLSPANVPAGAGSIQAEIYFSDKYRPAPLNFNDVT